MPKAKGSTTPGDVSAAHQWFEDFATKALKHHGALKIHIDQLEDENQELAAKLADEQAAHEQSKASAKEKYDRDVNALATKVAAFEKLVGNVKGILA